MKQGIFATLVLGGSLLLGAALAEASKVGNVAAGPVTSLERLDSPRALSSAPLSRRHFAIESWTTGNGARVLFVRADELPMLDVRLVFDAGAARDRALDELGQGGDLLLLHHPAHHLGSGSEQVQL